MSYTKSILINIFDHGFKWFKPTPDEITRIACNKYIGAVMAKSRSNAVKNIAICEAAMPKIEWNTRCAEVWYGTKLMPDIAMAKKEKCPDWCKISKNAVRPNKMLVVPCKKL